MLIHLSDALTKEGWAGKAEVVPELTEFDSGQGIFPVKEKTPVSFTFTNLEEGKAMIEGSGRLTFAAVCDRCLAEVPVEMELSFQRLVTSPEKEEDEDADDKSFMEGYQLNVEKFVYNEIIGNWPAKILCREDCKGLCPVCGQDLNVEECGCDTFVPDPRMAVIQDIFKRNKEV